MKLNFSVDKLKEACLNDQEFINVHGKVIIIGNKGLPALPVNW